MNLRLNAVWGLMDALLLSLFVVGFANPQNHLPLEYNILAVVVVELIAVGGAWMLAKGAKSFAFVKVLLLSFAMSAFLVFFLDSSASFDQTFLALFALQFVGLMFAALLIREPRKK